MKVDISFIHRDQMLLKLLHNINFVIKYEDGISCKLTIPKGYVTDGGTIPKIFWCLLSPFEDYFGACVAHDYLCDLAKFSKEPYKDRQRADFDFYVIMKNQGIKLSTRLTLYGFVTLYRWFRYNPLSIKLFGIPKIDKWNKQFFDTLH